MAALESKVKEVKQDVSSNTACIDEAERRTSDTEDATEKTGATLDLAIKRIVYLESKTDDLENRRRRKILCYMFTFILFSVFIFSMAIDVPSCSMRKPVVRGSLLFNA